MFKRIALWFWMNIAIIAIITIVFAILENVFGIKMDLWGNNYLAIWIYSLIIWFSGSFLSLALSKWMAKRAYHMSPLSKSQVSEYWEKYLVAYETVEILAKKNNIKMPEFCIYEDNDPNAFATGPSKNNSLVAVSTGLIENLDKQAIEWVIGHEMAHILNWDMVTMTLLQWVLNTFIVFISRIIANIFDNATDWKFGNLWYMAINILLQFLLWILATLIAMKFSRYREFRADAWSAKFLWKEKMIAWLEALKKMQNLASEDNSKLATMKISTKKRSGIMQLFSSHPDLDDRIKALENLRV